MPINFNLSNYTNPVFIETGTYMGEGVKKALECGFKKIYSIEIDETRYNNCKERFKENENVEILLGDSGKVLEELLPKINDKITFWLDAYYCGDGAEIGEKLTPFNEELETLIKRGNEEDIIIVNNWRCMNNTHIDETTKKKVGYIGERETLGKLRRINKDYKLNFRDGVESDDVLICYN